MTGRGGWDRSLGDHLPSGSWGRSNAPPSRHLWVGNLSHSILKQDLTEHFLQYGELESVAFQPGRSYAFINFKNEEEAVSAMKALQGFTVAGSPLRIEFAKAEEEEHGGSGGDGANGNGDYDDVAVLGSVEEVDRRAGGNHPAGPSGDCMVLDWLEGEFCISCNRGSGQVLVCSEIGCPVAIHKVCMNSEPKFDDMGKFCCPYCWYKRELTRTKELRRKAMLAKKELSNFIFLKRDDGNEEKQEDNAENMKAASISTIAGKINSGDSENGLHDDDNETKHHNREETQGLESSVGKKKSDEENISRTHGFDNVGNKERIEEELVENASDSEDDEIDEDRWRIQPSNPSHSEIVKDTIHLSTKGTSDVEGVLKENQGKWGKEEPMLPNAVGTTRRLITRDATSKVPTVESFEFVSPDMNAETPVRQKRVKRRDRRAQSKKVDSPKNTSFQAITSSKTKEKNHKGKATTAENSVQRQVSTQRIMIPILGTEKRRRLNWTAEEEDMLKKGVQKFSITTKQNTPWRKILEFGRNVFDSTRTPVDLKDKWKNIIARESPKTE